MKNEDHRKTNKMRKIELSLFSFRVLFRIFKRDVPVNPASSKSFRIRKLNIKIQELRVFRGRNLFFPELREAAIPF